MIEPPGLLPDNPLAGLPTSRLLGGMLKVFLARRTLLTSAPRTATHSLAAPDGASALSSQASPPRSGIKKNVTTLALLLIAMHAGTTCRCLNVATFNAWTFGPYPSKSTAALLPLFWTFSMMSARPLRPLPTRTQLLSALIGAPELLVLLPATLQPSPCAGLPMNAAGFSDLALLLLWTRLLSTTSLSKTCRRWSK